MAAAARSTSSWSATVGVIPCGAAPTPNAYAEPKTPYPQSSSRLPAPVRPGEGSTAILTSSAR